MSKNLDCTNYCLQCEEAAKKIAELQAKLAEQQAIVANFFKMYGKDVSEAGFEELNNLLAKAKEEGMKEIEELQRQNAFQLNMIASIWAIIPAETYFCANQIAKVDKYLTNKTEQSAAWLEASHIEWMKGLPIARYLYRYQTQDRSVVEIALRGSEEPTESIALYAIPTKKD